MIKIVIAPDSFKESLDAIAVTQAIKQGVLDALPEAHVQSIPMADGGEGTVACLAHSVSCRLINSPTVNALGQEIQAQWALLDDHTAFIEMASAAGLEQIPSEQRNIFQSSTYGVGLLIKHALDHQIKQITLTLGGSATNDAGIGMLAALGIRFLEASARPIEYPTPDQLAKIHTIDTRQLDPRLANIKMVIAADVRNPLYGPNGAAHIFAPQKGANPQQVQELDKLLRHIAQRTLETTGHNYAQAESAGAAGGVGFAALSFLKAEYQSGIKLLAEYTELERHIAEADLVITGEGRIDAQTLQGKTLAGIASLCLHHKTPLIALGGILQEGYEALYSQGLTAAFSINPGGISIEQSMQEAARLLRTTSGDIMRLWHAHQFTT